jgi:malonate-semialdehyde dehydrogenase (acetylating) / methylmalonate-semialdehyde dehydrogenase
MSTDTSVVTTPSAESAPTQVVPLFIGGQAVEASSGRFGTVYHPSSGTAARRVGFASRSDVDAAIAAAAAAFPAWAAAPPLRRARILNRFRDLLERDQNSLGAIITSEHGKVLSSEGSKWSSLPLAFRIS